MLEQQAVQSFSKKLDLGFQASLELISFHENVTPKEIEQMLAIDFTERSHCVHFPLAGQLKGGFYCFTQSPLPENEYEFFLEAMNIYIGRVLVHIESRKHILCNLKAPKVIPSNALQTLKHYNFYQFQIQYDQNIINCYAMSCLETIDLHHHITIQQENVGEIS